MRNGNHTVRGMSNQMQAGTETAVQRVLHVLEAFGIELAAGSAVCRRDGVGFEFKCPRTARQVLQSKLMFVEGPLGILHSQDVGELATEYRSYTNQGDYSLHVVLGKNGSAFAHLDRYNPYEGLVGFVLHGFLELFPHLAAKLMRALRVKGSALWAFPMWK